MQYTVNDPVRHDGRLYGVGDVITLDEGAADLVALHIITPIVISNPDVKSDVQPTDDRTADVESKRTERAKRDSNK